MMSNLKDFEEMEVWQDAQELAVDVYADLAQASDFFCCVLENRSVTFISSTLLCVLAKPNKPIAFSAFEALNCQFLA